MGLFDDLIPHGAAAQATPEGHAPAPAAAPAASAEPAAAPSPPGAIESFARGLGQGITFNFGDELQGLAEAGGMKPGSPLNFSNPLTTDALMVGAYKALISGNPAAKKAYKAAVTRVRAENNAAQKAHPVASTIGEITGALAIPMAPELEAPTLAGRVLRAAGAGGAYGAASAAGAGEGGLANRAENAVSGALVGAAAGGAAPLALSALGAAAKGAGKLAAPVVNSIRGYANPEAEASRRVIGAIARDYKNGTPGLTAGDLRAARASGQPTMVLDLGGETTRALARSAANTSPEGRAVLDHAINDRFEGQGPRVQDWLRSNFNYPDAAAQQAAIDEVAKTVNGPAYRQAYAEGAKGVWDPELKRLAAAPSIEHAIGGAVPPMKDRGIIAGFKLPRRNPFAIDPKTGAAVLRKNAQGNEIVPELAFWDQIVRNLGGRIGELQRSGNDTRARDIIQLKNALTAKLDSMVPSYKTARAGAAGFFGAENALEAGQNFVTSKMANGEARRGLAKMSPMEKQLFQDGFVSKLVESLGEGADRRNVLNQIAQSPAARERLQIALGRDKAGELEGFLRVEGIMDLARRAIQGNSTTARQLVEAGLAGGTGYGITSGDWNPRDLLTAAFVAGVARRGVQRIDQRVARRVAEMLVSQDPRVLAQGLKIVSKNPRFLDGLRRADQVIARVGAQQAPRPALQAPVIAAASPDQSQQAPAPSSAQPETKKKFSIRQPGG